MKKLLILTILFVAGGILISGCDDDFLNKSDVNSINSGIFYQTESDAIAAINAAYAPLQNRGLWARSFHFFQDFSSDDIAPTSNTQGPPFELISHAFGPNGNEHINRPWDKFYQVIALSNLVIQNVPGIKDIDASLRSRVVAEALFLRGLSYFYINALWGGGPLKTEDNINEIAVPRAGTADIWAQIERDLAAAANDLPVSYEVSDQGRATRGAALAQLGKAQLYQEKWSDAAQNLQAVVDLGAYRLVTADDFDGDVVAALRSNHAPGVKNNTEAIFEVQFKIGEGGFSWSGAPTSRRESSVRPREYGVDGNAFYNCKPSDELIAAYEDGDPRLQAFFFGPESTYKGEPYLPIFETSGYAWRKYQRDDAPEDNDSDVNHDVIRYADVLLMLAEAQIQQGNLSGGMTLINEVRRRADPSGNILPDHPEAVSREEALDMLIQERRVELCGEQVRRSDLVRWGLAPAHLQNFVAGKHEVFPIPQSEIDNNVAINENNPGY